MREENWKKKIEMQIKSQEAKLKKERDYQKEIRDNFCELFVKSMQSTSYKAFDLNNAKSDLFYLFVKRNVSGDYGTAKALATAIIKSQFEKLGKEADATEKIYAYLEDLDAKSIISIEDLRIKNVAPMIQDFLNEYIFDEENKVEIKNTKEVYTACAKAIFDEMESIYGNYIFLPMRESIPNLRNSINNEYKKRGYKPFPKDVRFLIRNAEANSEIVEEHQPYLMRTYKKIVKDYVGNYGYYTGSCVTADAYNEFWFVVKKFLDNMESRMSEKTKSSQEFIENRKIVDRFYNFEMERSRRTMIKEVVRGEYYNKTNKAFHNLKDGAGTSHDKTLINDFCKKAKELAEVAFAKKDESGVPCHPINYFACMPMHPILFRQFCFKLLKSDFLTEEQKKSVDEAKECVNKAIFNRNIQSKGNSGDLCNVEYALFGFGVDNGVVNYNGENFKNLISDVKEVLSKNNLPESRLCVKTIAWSLLEGTKDTEYLKSKRESNKEKGLSL